MLWTSFRCCLRLLNNGECCAPDIGLWFAQEYDDDEAVEDYYFSAAAGRARIVLGNRRFGENGYVSSGRSYARPAQETNPQVCSEPTSRRAC